MARQTRKKAGAGPPGVAEFGLEPESCITVQHARTHNLKGIDVALPRDALVVVTGLSGSGKSSLAFDTLYAEGQRRYIESLSSYARQFLEQMPRPDCDRILGLPPTIAIQQEMVGASPRSTVATTTEVYDFLRLLYARAGDMHCPDCGSPIRHQTVEQIVAAVADLPRGTRIDLLAPLVRGRKGHYRELFESIRADGYVRARIDGQIRDLDEVERVTRYRTHDIEAVVDRLVVTGSALPRLTDSIRAALEAGAGTCIVLREDGAEMFFSQLLACPLCGRSFEEPNPNTFSFNSPYGRCETCKGLGTVDMFDRDLIVPDRSLTLEQGAVRVWAEWTGRTGRHFARELERIRRALDIPGDLPFHDIPMRDRSAMIDGDGLEERTGIPRSHAVIPSLEALMEETERPATRFRLARFITAVTCPDCDGARLRPEALAVTVGGLNVAELTRLSVRDCLEFVGALAFHGSRAKIARPVLNEIRERLRFMLEVGLHYLSLDRRTNTLSRGEFQRIRLAAQIGSGLTGVCYVLDEPSIGLHQRDNRRLLDSLEQLRDAGNTVLVVEHDEETIRRADWVLDLGPGAGRDGGHVVYNGHAAGLPHAERSLTADYLTGRRTIPVPNLLRRVRRGRAIRLRGVREHNLKGIDVSFPLGVFCCVTGVSGSGKSTLVNDVLARALGARLGLSRPRPGAHRSLRVPPQVRRMLEIDQAPIGRSPRSCPATYTKLMDDVRRAFAGTRQAKVRGYGIGRFSFNNKEGRCPVCEGRGEKEIEMNFLADIRITCEECHGRRYNEQTLQIAIRGKSIADVLAMTVEEAFEFFQTYPGIARKLRTLRDVGLDYITLGQPSPTLSGGEAQRIKLARELSKATAGDTVYILDEPTTGLHFDDVRKLLRTLNGLVDQGNTVIVIEHNLEVVKCADHIIDLGPEGGDEGGRVVARGTPEAIMTAAESYTGRALKRFFKGRKQRKATRSP